MSVAPLTAEEKAQIDHTGHLLMEKVSGDVVELVAIGGPISGKKIRRFASKDELAQFAKTHKLSFRMREGT